MIYNRLFHRCWWYGKCNVFIGQGLAARGEDVTVLPKLAVEQNNGFTVHHETAKTASEYL